MAVDLRTAGLVLLICRRLMAVQADPVARADPVVARMTNSGHHPTARETVRRARCEVAYSSGPPGRWWDEKSFAKSLGLSGDQRKRMDAIFGENKGTLLSLYHSLEAEEAGLERLTTGTHLDEEQIFRQIDKVTEARAALEKANAHMLLEIRKQMTDEQAEKLDEHRLKPPS